MKNYKVFSKFLPSDSRKKERYIKFFHFSTVFVSTHVSSFEIYSKWKSFMIIDNP